MSSTLNGVTDREFHCIVLVVDEDREPASDTALLVLFIVAVAFIALCLFVIWLMRVFASARPGESF